MVRKLDENNQYMYTVKKPHSHMIDKRDVEKQESTKKMKILAKTSGCTTRQVIAQSLAGVSTHALAQMPEYDALAKTVRNERKDAERKAPPTALIDVNIPDDFCKTSSGENFLMYDSGVYEEDKRIMIFSTNKHLEFLATCDTVHMDGTFKSCPQLFGQLYVMHGN